MSTAILIAKLLEIERLVGKGDPATIRSMLLDVQAFVLELEQQLIATIQECQRLRERMENCERSALAGAGFPQPRISMAEEAAMELSRPAGGRKKGRVRRFLADTSTETIT